MNQMDEILAVLLLVMLPAAFGWALLVLWRKVRAALSPVRWPQVVLGNVLLLACLLSLAFLGGEIYVRGCYDTTDSLGYTKVSERWVRRHWQINAATCRDNIQYYPTRAAGKRRVTLLGDSFTAGHGVKNVEDRFANRLRAAHPEWEVHALAQPGYETIDEINILKACLENHYQLDLVVLVYCLNDISDLVPEWNAAREQIYSDVDRAGWFKNSSYFYNLLYHRFKAARNPWMKDYFQFVRDTAAGPIWEQQQERLASLQKLVEANGGRLVVVTFPFLHAVGADYQFHNVHAALDRYWSEHRVPHLDLLSVYEKLPSAQITVNRYDAHPNEYAHRLAAEAMDQFLRPYLSPVK